MLNIHECKEFERAIEQTIKSFITVLKSYSEQFQIKKRALYYLWLYSVICVVTNILCIIGKAMFLKSYGLIEGHFFSSRLHGVRSVLRPTHNLTEGNRVLNRFFKHLRFEMSCFKVCKSFADMHLKWNLLGTDLTVNSASFINFLGLFILLICSICCSENR